MYNTILVPIALDHNPNIPKALQAARLLAGADGKITALTVLEAIPDMILAELPKDQMAQNRQLAEEMLGAQTAGYGDIRTVAIDGHSGRAILDFATQNGVDCIVIASHRPGLQDYFLGSTAARVVRHAVCAVHVVR